jgi:uncharacterized protein YodC (DUF2158 family)
LLFIAVGFFCCAVCAVCAVRDVCSVRAVAFLDLGMAVCRWYSRAGVVQRLVDVLYLQTVEYGEDAASDVEVVVYCIVR